jgi:hypothetical protein
LTCDFKQDCPNSADDESTCPAYFSFDDCAQLSDCFWTSEGTGMTFEPQTPDVIMQENWDFGHGPTADWNGTTDRNVVFMREMKEEGNNEAVAEMTSPVYRGADAKCLLTFWYYVGGNPDGRSVVPNLFTANDGLEYKMDHLPESGGELSQWQWRLIGIG